MAAVNSLARKDENRMKLTTRKLTACAVLAALYAALTLLLAPIAYGNVQMRVSEALTVLPFLAPYTGAGLFVGCLIANLLSPFGINPLDVVFGSLATLLAAWLTSRCKSRWLAPLPPVLVNAVVIGGVLAYTSAPENFFASFVLFAAQIGLGQLAACYIGGSALLYALEKTGLKRIFER